eukprot:TRINITY_DN6775_c0_g1_i4.p1 TRINITY_DN6775_c0_g1~~TRINITY_DN6775_c0_g1_i4.p1  ORF type:complete len:446 (+),score=95.09 TRINITY_DN6775_c0_g1_i4:180-1340(+)
MVDALAAVCADAAQLYDPAFVQSSPMQYVFVELQQGNEQLKAFLGTFTPKHKELVQKALQDYHESFKDIKGRIKTRDDLLLDFDAARTALDKAQKAGDAAKLSKAEFGLQRTKEDYENANAALIKDIDAFYTAHYARIERACKELMAFHVDVYRRACETCNLIASRVPGIGATKAVEAVGNIKRVEKPAGSLHHSASFYDGGRDSPAPEDLPARSSTPTLGEPAKPAKPAPPTAGAAAETPTAPAPAPAPAVSAVSPVTHFNPGTPLLPTGPALAPVPDFGGSTFGAGDSAMFTTAESSPFGASPFGDPFASSGSAAPAFDNTRSARFSVSVPISAYGDTFGGDSGNPFGSLGGSPFGAVAAVQQPSAPAEPADANRPGKPPKPPK